MPKSYKHFDHKERTLIYWWRKENLRQREMARRLRRSHVSISRELRRKSLVWATVFPERGSDTV